MKQTNSKDMQRNKPVPEQRIMQKTICRESHHMTSKFVAQQNLAAANEGWTELKRERDFPKQDR